MKPKKSKNLPEVVARELYIHEVISKGLARVFFSEYYEEERLRTRGGKVHFRFADVVYYFAQAAAMGVIGNLAYDTLKAIVRAVRNPKQEIPTGDIRFEVVVSRKTYNRLRLKRHPGKRAFTTQTEIEDGLRTQYKLMVGLQQPKKLKGKKK